jgi:hypothetical protein
MPSSRFSANCKPPEPPILASLRGGLSVKTIKKQMIDNKFKKWVIQVTSAVFVLCSFKRMFRSSHWNHSAWEIKKYIYWEFLETFSRIPDWSEWRHQIGYDSFREKFHTI